MNDAVRLRQLALCVMGVCVCVCVCVVIVLSAGIIAGSECLWGWKGGICQGSLPGQVRGQVLSCCYSDCNIHVVLMLPVLAYNMRFKCFFNLLCFISGHRFKMRLSVIDHILSYLDGYMASLIDLCIRSTQVLFSLWSKGRCRERWPQNLFPPAMIFSLTASRWWRQFAVFTDGWKCGGTSLFPYSPCHFLSSLSLRLTVVLIPSLPLPLSVPPCWDNSIFPLAHAH